MASTRPRPNNGVVSRPTLCMVASAGSTSTGTLHAFPVLFVNAPSVFNCRSEPPSLASGLKLSIVEAAEAALYRFACTAGRPEIVTVAARRLVEDRSESVIHGFDRGECRHGIAEVIAR